jgi:hypothetical protein
MKIKTMAAFTAVLVLSLCACRETAAAPEASGDEAGAVTTASAVAPAAGAVSTASPDLSRYGDNARYCTTDEIYIEWIDAGYVSGMPTLLMITDREQLEYAKTRYPLFTSEEAEENKDRKRCSSLGEPFARMTEKYPVEKYTYLLEYISASGGGYHIIPAGLVITDDTIAFVNSPDSRYPERGDTIPDVCSDYCYMAAVPKEYLAGGSYSGWTVPDAGDMYQDEHYELNCLCYDTEDVYDIYGDTRYLMRTREQYDDFLAMSAHLTVGEARVVCDLRPDFENEAVAAYFLTSEGIAADSPASGENKVVIDGKLLSVNYGGFTVNEDRIGTYMIYAVIPSRFLTEESYDGWQTPPRTVPAQTGIPDIDRSSYGKDAIILTADDIVLYGTHTSCTDFSGKYVMCGEDGVSEVWDGLGLCGDNNFVKFVEANMINLDYDRYPDQFGNDNVLFVQYNNPGFYGSGMKPYALVIDGNKAEFLYTENKSADKTDNRPDSYCFFAAVPRYLLGDINFAGWSVHDTVRDTDETQIY